MTGPRPVLGMWGHSHAGYHREMLVSFDKSLNLINWTHILLSLKRRRKVYYALVCMIPWRCLCPRQSDGCLSTPTSCSFSVFPFSHSVYFFFSFFHIHCWCWTFVCCPPPTPTPPGLCPMSPCRAWWASAMRGSAGINLGNLISGAVVPALNISISLGWLAGWLVVPELDLRWPAAGEGGRQGEV